MSAQFGKPEHIPASFPSVPENRIHWSLKLSVEEGRHSWARPWLEQRRFTKIKDAMSQHLLNDSLSSDFVAGWLMWRQTVVVCFVVLIHHEEFGNKIDECTLFTIDKKQRQCLLSWIRTPVKQVNAEQMSLPSSTSKVIRTCSDSTNSSFTISPWLFTSL
jgi:hypothetical protein